MGSHPPPRVLCPAGLTPAIFSTAERRYLESARLARLATADADGRPHAVPACFVLVDDAIVTPLVEKPKEVPPTDLRRVRDVEANPVVCLLVDHWAEYWDALGWVQVRGRAGLLLPGDAGHDAAVAALRKKYQQYADHGLEDRPAFRIEPRSVRSWGRLDRPR